MPCHCNSKCIPVLEKQLKKIAERIEELKKSEVCIIEVFDMENPKDGWIKQEFPTKEQAVNYISEMGTSCKVDGINNGYKYYYVSYLILAPTIYRIKKGE